MNIDLRLGDCLEVLKTIPDNSVDSVVTDPPYGLGFMNKEWDSPEKLRALTQREEERSAQRKAEGKSPTTASFSKSVPPGLAIKGAREGRWFQEWCELWATELLRVLKPGGHLISFCAPRTYHRMATAFEDAGFEIRDQIMWVFGSGFPKSLNIGKAIDKIEGNDREVVGEMRAGKTALGQNSGWNQHENRTEIEVTKGNSEWEGWGTALKPAHEPMVLARKPLSEKSIAENVLKHGTGGINIDGSRIEFEDTPNPATNPKFRAQNNYKMPEPGQESNGAVKFTSSKNEYDTSGRFPANIIFDEEAGKLLDEQSGVSKGTSAVRKNKLPQKIYGGGNGIPPQESKGFDDKGGASRFFLSVENNFHYCYICGEANEKEKWENKYKNVLNAETTSKNTPVITEHIVPQNATENLNEKAVLCVKNVGNLCDLCATHIVRCLVEINTTQEASHLIQDFIGNSKNYTLLLNLVSYVEKMVSIDTTQTTTNLLRLFGSAFLAIENYIKKDTKGVVEQKSEYLPFIYQAKASKKDRNEGIEITNGHPTVKPTDLMRYLINLVTPKGGTTLDPFMGSGSTGKAAIRCGVNFIGIEKEQEYMDIARARIEHEKNKPVQQELF